MTGHRTEVRQGNGQHQAICRDCAWSGPTRSTHGAADRDGADHTLEVLR